MTIVVDTITPCPTGGHYILAGTVNGNPRSIAVERSKLDLDFEETSADDRIIDRLRSARKEAGAVTLGQTRNAIVGKTFQI